MIHNSEMEAFFPVESMFQNHEHNILLPSSSNPSAPRAAQDFHGVSSALMRRSMSFSGVDMSEEVRLEDDMFDDVGAPLGEKKKRLNMEQVRALEKSFDLGNKLEPERKLHLAKSLGLQPRQVAIWFQNRRARWKTKQMEKDYEVLKKQVEALKTDNELLRAQNKLFHSELLALQKKELATGSSGTINLNRENEVSWSNGRENSIDVNLGTTGTTSVESGLFSNSHPTNSHISLPSTMGQPAGPTHPFLLGSLGSDLQAPIIDGTTSDESLCNMFNNIEEQLSGSPWSWY